MNLTNVSKEFLNLILTFLFQLLSKFDPQLRRPTPPSNEDADPEVAAQPDGNDTVDQLQAPDEPAEPGNGFDPDTPELVVEHRNNNLNNAMVAFCFASSMAIALLPIQVHSQLHSSLLWLALAVLLGFTSFFLSEFIDSRFVVTVRVLQKFGQSFTVTAFYMAISLRFPFYFKCTSWAVYFISFLTIFISSFF
nr:hypothetical protein CFP56_26577 [Quercus suber]